MNTDQMDHCKAVNEIMKSGIDCYMSKGTKKALKLTGHRVHIIESEKQFKIGSLIVMPLKAQHDAAEPLSFLIANDQHEKLLFITDSYYCRYKFSRLTHIMIETNYDDEILDQNIAAGLVPHAIRRRIKKSHFSFPNVKKFLQANNMSWVKEIHLIHLSDNNADPVKFKTEIQKLTGKPVFIGGES